MPGTGEMMNTGLLFTSGLCVLFALGAGCGIRLMGEYRTRREPTLMTVALVWAFYGVHFLLVLIAAADSTWPVPLPRWAASAGGAVLVILGGAIYLAAAAAFGSLKRLSGLDSSRVIAGGIYRWSRNPQTVGWMTFLLGIALLSSSGMVLLLAVLFWISFRIYLPLEEDLLERLHGQAYRDYRAETHRYFGAPLQKKK
jgi:protein-S-isoprenylcysteine O-methyltransferase Ste14